MKRGSDPPYLRLFTDLAGAAEALNDIAASVLVLDTDGIIMYANVAACRASSNDSQPLTGRPLHEFLPAAAAAERIAQAREAIETGRQVRCLGLVAGRLNLWSVRPVRTEGPVSAIMVCHPVDTLGTGAELFSDSSVRRSAVADLGGLARLSFGELAILRLIGMGLTTPEISSRLHRTRKSIEGRRAALGEKFNARNRIELARRAMATGLDLLSDREFAALEPLWDQTPEAPHVEMKPNPVGLHSRSRSEPRAHEP